MTHRHLFALALTALLVPLGAVAAQDATPAATETGPLPDTVIAHHEGLFPEGVEWDSAHNRFLVSSVGEGTVYAVTDDGTTTPFIVDERIPASTGLEIDEANNRLLVAATDQRMKGFLGIYNLDTGENIAFVDFRPLGKSTDMHFINDEAVDNDGNAYVTDSFAGVIYRVTPRGNASIFLQDESFSTHMALNGIVYDATDNALIAVRAPDLIKIPLNNPAGFKQIQMTLQIPHADGLVLLDDQTLVAVRNDPGMVYKITSSDGWESARLDGTFDPGLVFPTTVANRNGEAYVLYAHLHEQKSPLSGYPIQRADFADVLATPEATAEMTMAAPMEATADMTMEALQATAEATP